MTDSSVVILILYFATLGVRLFVSNKRQNGRTDQAQFFVGPLVTPGKMYGRSNFQKFAYNKIRFLKILKIHNFFFIKSATFFVFVLQCIQLENKFIIEKRWAYTMCLFV